LTGNVKGDVTGDLTGNVTGNVKSTLINTSYIVGNDLNFNTMHINGKLLVDGKRNITANSLSLGDVQINPDKLNQTTYNKFIEDNNDVTLGVPGDIDDTTGITYSRNLNLIYDKNTNPLEIFHSVGNASINGTIGHLRTSVYSPTNNTLYMGGKFIITKNSLINGAVISTTYNNVIGYDFSGNKFVGMAGTTNTGLIGTEVRKFVFDNVHNKIYCTGQFDTDGSGNILNNIAVFDIATTSWSPLKNNGSQYVFGLATGQVSQASAASPISLFAMGLSGAGADITLDITNQYLYVVGQFSYICNTSANQIAVYDIQNNVWSQVGSGLNYYNIGGLNYGNDVLCNTMVLDTSGSKLYFCNKGGISVNGSSGQLIQYTRVAGNWGVNNWAILDNSLHFMWYQINCLEYNRISNILYIGGYFWTTLNATTVLFSYNTVTQRLSSNITNIDPNNFATYCIRHDITTNFLFFSTNIWNGGNIYSTHIIDLNTNTTVSKYYALPNVSVQFCTIGPKIVILYDNNISQTNLSGGFGFYTFELTNSTHIYDKNGNLIISMLIPFEQANMFYSNSLQKWLITDVKSGFTPINFN
jgi:hypothetical protein